MSNEAVSLSRRALLGAASGLGLAGATSGLGLLTVTGRAEAAGEAKRWAARAPAGMSRLRLPGKIVKVRGKSTMQSNGLWPLQGAADRMLARAMQELTGERDLGKAFGRFVHPKDTVAIKPNGIAGRDGQTMASNKELILAVARGVIAAGVPAEHITIFEQYSKFLRGTRVVGSDAKLDAAFPAGILTSVHSNRDATMGFIDVGGISTRYVRPFTEATAVINVAQIKDHSICGYTGALKNITHGCNVNPHAFHDHHASPQIAHLYAQEVVKSRVVLHITDAFKVMYDGGPLDKKPQHRTVYEAVYACTDPVAMDMVGWRLVEELRAKNGLPSLTDAGREPTYIRVAGQLGLGVHDRTLIRLQEVTA